MMQHFKKRPLLFMSEIDIFDVFFKRLYEESFQDLQKLKISNLCHYVHKIAPLLSNFGEITQKCSFNI